MNEDSIANKKWKKFVHRAKLFNSVPFVDFALAAGSMAIGNSHKYSDFDVIVGVKNGRIFTARFFAVMLFGLRGWRRKRGHDKNVDKRAVSDKICLSHWVTENSYRLSPPHNEYWDKLYRSLVPLVGDEEKINKLFEANDWTSAPPIRRRKDKFAPMNKTLFRKLSESILSGRLGDFVEKILKSIQVSRIERGINDKNNHNPRIIYSDDELEFHPDTKRIDNMIANKEI